MELCAHTADSYGTVRLSVALFAIVAADFSQPARLGSTFRHAINSLEYYYPSEIIALSAARCARMETCIFCCVPFICNENMERAAALESTRVEYREVLHIYAPV